MKNGKIAFLFFLLVFCSFLFSVPLCAGILNSRLPQIQKNDPQRSTAPLRGTTSARRSGDSSVVLKGTIDGEGTFVFQENRIEYKHSQFEYPTDMTVDGKPWRNLREPFELGFTPVPDTAEIVDKSGRGTIRLSSYQNRVELYVYDSPSSSASYRIEISFRKKTSTSTVRKAGTESRKPEENTVRAGTDNGDDEFFISLPGEEPEKNKNGAAGGRDPGPYAKMQGVIYGLTPRSEGRSSSLISTGKKNDTNVDAMQILRKFVLGQWQLLTDESGRKHYPELDQCFERKSAPKQSCFYLEMMSAREGAGLFNCGSLAGNSGWLAIYSGYVIAPFSGKFRFLGGADDVMLVRFNRQIVIDYGLCSLTTGLQLDSGTSEILSLLNGGTATKEERRLLYESPLYSKHKLEVAFPDFCSNHGLAASPVLSVQKGQVIPIDIIVSERSKNNFCMVLLVERLSQSGAPMEDTDRSISLFRTTPDLPERTDSSFSLPTFNPDGPIWRLVDAKGNPVR